MAKDREILEWFNKLKRMSYSQFEESLKKYGYESYKMGVEEGERTGTLWTEEQIYDLLLSKGIDKDLAIDITNELVEGVDVERSQSD